MAKTYTAAGSATAGQVYTASAHNVIVTDVNNLIVPAVAIVKRTAVQSVANAGSGAVISWDGENVDNDGMWASGTAITIQTDGVYAATLYVNFNTASATGLREANILKNGAAPTPNINLTLMPNASFSHNLTVSGLLDVVAGDVISATAYQNSGSAMNITANIGLVWIGKKS